MTSIPTFRNRLGFMADEPPGPSRPKRHIIDQISMKAGWPGQLDGTPRGKLEETAKSDLTAAFSAPAPTRPRPPAKKSSQEPPELSHTIKAGDIHDHPDGICAELPLWNSLETGEGAIAGAVGVSTGTPLVAFANTFRLSSNPTARTTIYLDFDGHTTTGTPWNNSTMGPSFYSPAYNTDGNVSVFSNSE
ncbi:MAG: hypothetical protein ACKOPT_05905, partial [Cyanobium sp.]